MRKQTIICDWCGAELVRGGRIGERYNCISFRGTIGMYQKSEDELVDFYFATKGQEELHFCDGACIEKWVSRESGARYAALNRKKVENEELKDLLG